ncbi:MAG TPA: hypothetical protein VD886_13010 [Herpetosiphonaceae bacterium]|nr:hypothetical protein [Herpetosiphonaceae bacterium]
MDPQNDEKPGTSRRFQLKRYKNAIVCGVAGIILCIVMFVFAGLPLNPNQETFDTAKPFVRLLIIMNALPFTISTVNIYILSQRHHKNHKNTLNPMLAALITTVFVVVFGGFAKFLLAYGTWGVILFGFQLGCLSGHWSRQAFNGTIKLKK